jgi:hypothetical protein
VGEKKMVGAMTYEVPSAQALDYLPCRYGMSKLLFRGPRRDLVSDYIAFLGGSETYGKFVETPFSDRAESGLGLTCVNLGFPNAGLDVFVHAPEILGIASRSKLTVLQVVGAQNMSNRFYRVHPRRNDRFVEPSALLSAIYREVDFTEFHFNRHMLSTLQMISPDRFSTVRDELQNAWVARMKLLVRSIEGKIALLWLRDEQATELGHDPLFVTEPMLDRLRPEISDLIEVSVRRAGDDLHNMVFGSLEEPAAAHMLSAASHHKIADAITDRLPVLLK